MRPRRATIVLAVIAALLGAYILLVERRRPSTDEQRAGRARLLAAFDRARVRAVTITRAGAAPFSLERAGSGGGAWRILPGGHDADESAVQALLTELDFADADREAEVSRAEAGLDPPRVALTVDAGTGGAPAALALGRPDVTGRGVFAEAGGDGRVRVAPRRLLDLADRDAAAFRDRRAVPVTASAVRALAWEGHTLALVEGRWRNERGEWVSVERASEAARRLADLRAARFVAPPAPPPPAPRALEVTAGETWTLRFRDGGCPPATGAAGPAEGETLVERAASQPRPAAWMCVPREAADGLWRALAAAHARDDRLLAAPPESVTAFELAAPGGRRLALARGQGGWRFTAPGPAELRYGADTEAVMAWLDELGRTHVPAAPPGAPAQVTLKATSPLFTETTPVSASAPAAVLALLEPDPLRFRDRRVLDLARFDAQRLRIAPARGGATIDLAKSADQTWRAAAPAGATLDDGALDRLLAALTNLRAERFLPPDTKLAAERTFTLTEQPPGAATPVDHVLELGPSRPDGCMARLAAKKETAKAMFIVTSAVCDDLRVAVVRSN